MLDRDYEEIRIALAEAMGWAQDERWLFEGKPGWYHKATGRIQASPPDPRHSDTDAMAVVEWLRRNGNSVSLLFGEEGDVVCVNAGSIHIGNYREGVVTLAWKVLNGQ